MTNDGLADNGTGGTADETAGETANTSNDQQSQSFRLSQYSHGAG